MRLLSPGMETSLDAWKQEQNGLPHPPAAPGCGRDGLPHLSGQCKALQGERRGRVVGLYRLQAARVMLVFPFIPRGMWTPMAVGNLFPHPQRDNSQVAS